jgi:hypothetical protein
MSEMNVMTERASSRVSEYVKVMVKIQMQKATHTRHSHKQRPCCVRTSSSCEQEQKNTRHLKYRQAHRDLLSIRGVYITTTHVKDDRRTGDVDEKKSISLPTVNGMLIDTDDETKRSPIPMRRGLRSSFASETIFRSEDVF